MSLFTISAPSGTNLPCLLSHQRNSVGVKFTPLEVGPHKIHVSVGDSPVSGSPFTCQVYDTNAVRVIDIDRTAKKEREIGFTSKPYLHRVEEFFGF